MPIKATALILFLFALSSFTNTWKTTSEEEMLRRLELQALIEGAVGHEYIHDLTGITGCNKTKIKYLGVVKTTKGQEYKILNSFFVFSTSKDMCHGASFIKIYNSKNRFIGAYNVGMPDGLPDSLKNNKLMYLKNSKECTLRNKQSINFDKGLPKCFFVRCAKSGGDQYCFSGRD